MKRIVPVICICACVLAGESPRHVCLASNEVTAIEATIADDPEARALYESMGQAMQNATTLSYEAVFQTGPDKHELDHGLYKVWMKKPNYFRVETRLGDDDQWAGVIVGDGQSAWSYWPSGRPWFSGEDPDAYEKTRSNVYIKEPAPPGKYAIRYSAVMKKSNHFAIVDPSRFFGVRCSLEPVIDWVRIVDREQVDGEDCCVIEVSYMKHQRSCYFWVSQRDHLPRKLKRIVRATEDLIDEEQWSKVTLNGVISQERFAWQPPDGWRQWQPPAPEDRLLKPGQPAPDFELKSPDGGRIRLSTYRGSVVWLTFWRVQCPPCRDEIPYLQRLYEQNRDEGLVVLGFNFADDVKSASDFLHEHSAAFPNIIDSSDEAIKTGFFTYGARAAPVNYIIGRDGKIVSAWLGYEKSGTQGLNTLTRLGLEATDP